MVLRVIRGSRWSQYYLRLPRRYYGLSKRDTFTLSMNKGNRWGDPRRRQIIGVSVSIVKTFLFFTSKGINNNNIIFN